MADPTFLALVPLILSLILSLFTNEVQSRPLPSQFSDARRQTEVLKARDNAFWSPEFPGVYTLMPTPSTGVQVPRALTESTPAAIQTRPVRYEAKRWGKGKFVNGARGYQNLAIASASPTTWATTASASLTPGSVSESTPLTLLASTAAESSLPSSTPQPSTPPSSAPPPSTPPTPTPPALIQPSSTPPSSTPPSSTPTPSIPIPSIPIPSIPPPPTPPALIQPSSTPSSSTSLSSTPITTPVSIGAELSEPSSSAAPTLTTLVSIPAESSLPSSTSKPSTPPINPAISTPTTTAPATTTPATTTPVKSTTSAASTIPTSAPPPSSPQLNPGHSGSLQVSFENNLAGSDVHVYITGLDSNGKVVMLTTDGDFYYPTTSSKIPQPVNANVAIPLSDSLTIPGFISSARLWFADGTLDFFVVATAAGPGIVAPTTVNPNDSSHNVNWGFVELTYIESGLFANLSYVDFVGLPLGMKLSTTSSGTQAALGLPGDGVAQVCEKLKAQASTDGQPWDQLCIPGPDGNVIRVNSPGSLMADAASSFEDYFAGYINSVWQRYRSSKLTINAQNDLGSMACMVGGDDMLTCDGDNRGYSKPTATDIFTCSTGPFAIMAGDNSVHLAVVPRLCAAFNRATFELAGGNVQPGLQPSSYYQVQPNNQYSAIVHQVELDGRGYAFPYDDVSPDSTTDVAGSVFATDPQVLTVSIGG